MRIVLNGVPLDTIYFYTLITCAAISVVLFLFGDIFDFDGPVDPMLIVPWIAFTSLFGYLGEKAFDVNSWVILFIGIGLATLLVFLLNFYILVPIRNSEATISMSEKDMEGLKGIVITPIPIKGMGEIKISSVTGSMSRPAAFYEEQEQGVAQGKEVLIIEIRDRVCYVVPYKDNFM